MPKWGIVFLVFIVIGLVAFLVIRANPFTKKEPPKNEIVATGPAGVFTSEDGGASWAPLSGSVGLKPLAMSFQESGADNFYLGTKGAGLWIRKNGTGALERVNDPSGVLSATADVYAVAQTPSGDVLYLGVLQNKRGRLLRLTEGGAQEIYKTALENYPVLGVYVDPMDPLHINFIAEGAFYETRDGGKSKSWEPLARIKDGFSRLVAGTKEGELFALDNKNTLFVTTTGGRSWQETSVIAVEKNKIKQVHDMKYDVKRQALVIASDFGLLETRDHGESWLAFRTPVPPRTLQITAFGAHPRFGEVLWMAAERLIYRSDDGGITWSNVELPISKNVRFLVANTSNPKEIYAGISE